MNSLHRKEPPSIGIPLIIAFFLISISIFTMSGHYDIRSLWLGLYDAHAARTSESTSFQLSGISENPKELQPLCDESGPRSIVCDMNGDIRIIGRSSSIVLVSPARNESLKIRPYARKGDFVALQHVKEMSIRTLRSKKEAPLCNSHHNVPAIVFSAGGYAGNLFHDFSDILIPLFLTSYQYHAEVQFMIIDMQKRWIEKFQLPLRRLSRYEIIDLDRSENTECFSHVIVGLKSHKEFNIDISRPPTGYTMADFTGFMRRSYRLERHAIDAGIHRRKPRLMIISRKHTRRFMNIGEIVETARDVGFEIVVGEAELGTNATEFAKIVNSCDVMMGVHGAGLGNLVFLPANSVLIQIVPWGGLKWIAVYDFGWPAGNAKLKYMQYEINIEESSLVEEYPRDHKLISDPSEVHKKGWSAVRETYLVRQNIKIDVKRFKGVLLEALQSVLGSTMVA